MSQASLIRVLSLYRVVDSAEKQTSVEKPNKEKIPVSDKAISEVIPFPSRTPFSRMINITAQWEEFTTAASYTLKFKHSEFIFTQTAFQNSALNELLVLKYEKRKQQQI